MSLMTKREDFVLTELDCPCGETDNLEHCSATRYEVGELPCMPGETAGVRCYNGEWTDRWYFNECNVHSKFSKFYESSHIEVCLH